jgi:hypothetical protein
MLHAALLAAVFSSAAVEAPVPPKTSIQKCFGTMDGAIYHGDPSDRTLMKTNVAVCARGIAQLGRMRPTAAQGPEKLFLTGRLLDRAATLSYMGLDDAVTALREVKLANLYFRVAAGLNNQSTNYHDAAIANVALTHVQLHTLQADSALAMSARVKTTALPVRGTHPGRPVPPAPVTAAAYSAYRRL